MTYSALQAENELLRQTVQTLQYRVNQLERLIYAARRERFVPEATAQQGVLFEEALLGAQEDMPRQEEEAIQVVEVEKRKQPPVRKPAPRNTFPASLRREEQRIEPADIEGLTKIGEDVTELLAYTPASVYVKRIVRPRYVNKQDEEQGVQQAPVPVRLLPKGGVDESLLAHLIIEKVQFHTPIYRLVKKFKQMGIQSLPENTLHNWLHRSAEALRPLHDLLLADILQTGYCQMDESPIKVLTKNKPGATHRGYMWVNHAPTLGAVAFSYDPSRATAVAERLTNGFKGILQTDGYTVYETIGSKNEVQLIYCMAHARRKFFEAQDSDTGRATFFLQHLQHLYQLEQQAREREYTPDQRLDLRQEKAIPILEALRQWLTYQYADATLLPKSPIRQAIDYTLQRWSGLCAYAHNGILEIDNNLIENTIRPMAIGRKNYLFAGSHDAAYNLAVLYSIIGTCQKAGINTQNYLEWLLRKVACEKITPDAVQWLPHRVDKTLFL